MRGAHTDVAILTAAATARATSTAMPPGKRSASAPDLRQDLNAAAQTLHGRGDPAEGDEQQSLAGVLWGVVDQEQAQWAADAAAAADTAAAPDGNNSDGGGSDATVVSDEDLHYEDRWD